MVRAILKGGMIKPLESLPETWMEGQALLIDTEEGASQPTAEELRAWSKEIEAAAAKIPEEEHRRFLAALEEIERESKDEVRREWGIA